VSEKVSNKQFEFQNIQSCGIDNHKLITSGGRYLQWSHGGDVNKLLYSDGIPHLTIHSWVLTTGFVSRL